MSKLMQYVSTPANRVKVIVGLGRFSVAGGLLVAAILLSATFAR